MMNAKIIYWLLADLVVLFHFAFVVFAVFGGLLAMGRRRFICAHLSAVIWAAFIEFSGWICPLTPLENWLKSDTGEAGYQADFIAHYLLPVLYPEGLTRAVQMLLGILVLAINLAIYGWIFRSNIRAKIAPARRKS
jgi:hypothetical protein